jgi:hypothetical protein
MKNETTIDAIRHSREQRINGARQDYTRLLRSAAVKPEMSAADAAAFEHVLNTLGITLDQLDADLKAVRDVTAKEAERATDADLARLAGERDRLQAENDRLTQAFRDAEAAMKVGITNVALARRRHTGALDVNRIIAEDITAIRHANPRAFGEWETPAPAVERVQLPPRMVV